MSRLTLAAFGLATAAAAVASTLSAQGTSPAQSAAPACSPEALPPAEKAVMEREYAKRKREDGKSEADAWLRNEARAFLARLIESGVCTAASRADDPVAAPSRPSAEKAPRGKDGKPCKRTRLENRNIANISGGPMMMVLVPVCAD